MVKKPTKSKGGGTPAAHDRHRPRSLDELQKEVGAHPLVVVFRKSRGGLYYFFYQDRIVRIYSAGSRLFHIEPERGIQFKPLTAPNYKDAKYLAGRIVQGLHVDDNTATSTTATDTQGTQPPRTGNILDMIDNIRAQLRKIEHASSGKTLDLVDEARSQLRQIERALEN